MKISRRQISQIISEMDMETAQSGIKPLASFYSTIAEDDEEQEQQSEGRLRLHLHPYGSEQHGRCREQCLAQRVPQLKPPPVLAKPAEQKSVHGAALGQPPAPHVAPHGQGVAARDP